MGKLISTPAPLSLSHCVAQLAAVTSSEVRWLCKRLSEQGFQAWLVGGAVRDQLLALLSRHSGRPSGATTDWDIATDAHPEQVMGLFPRVIPTGIKHGTVTVLLKHGHYEVTTFRAEAAYEDGRRPTRIDFIDSINADLARRDFTVNAIAYDPLKNVLVDPFGGIDDCQRRLLRAVGDARQRFEEDGLRPLRAARLAAVLDMTLEPATESAIRPSLTSYRKVSVERIRDEWLKAMLARKPSIAFGLMQRHGLLDITLPPLSQLAERGQQPTLWEYTLACLDLVAPEPLLRIAALFHALGWPSLPSAAARYDHGDAVEPLLGRLRLSNQQILTIAKVVRGHWLPAGDSDAALRRWLCDVGVDALEPCFELAKARYQVLKLEASPSPQAVQQRCRQLLEQGFPLEIKQLAIRGSDLLALGFSAGPELGQVLQELWLRAIDDPNLNQRESLLALARERLH